MHLITDAVTHTSYCFSNRRATPVLCTPNASCNGFRELSTAEAYWSVCTPDLQEGCLLSMRKWYSAGMAYVYTMLKLSKTFLLDYIRSTVESPERRRERALPRLATKRRGEAPRRLQSAPPTTAPTPRTKRI